MTADSKSIKMDTEAKEKISPSARFFAETESTIFICMRR